MTPPRPPSGPAAGARLLWVVAAAVLLGALRGPSENDQRLVVALAGRLRLVPPR